LWCGKAACFHRNDPDRKPERGPGGTEEVPMAAIVRSWMRTHCNACKVTRIFELKSGWVLQCRECGNERHLATNGLLAKAS
jgi:hypothetical protein